MIYTAYYFADVEEPDYSANTLNALHDMIMERAEDRNQPPAMFERLTVERDNWTAEFTAKSLLYFNDDLQKSWAEYKDMLASEPTDREQHSTYRGQP